MAIFHISALALALSRSNVLAADWSHLPWEKLEQYNFPVIVADSSSQATTYTDECLPEFQKPSYERSNHNIVDSPSGLCMNHFTCAFAECNPLDPTLYGDISVEERLAAVKAKFDNYDLPVEEGIVDDWIKPDNPAWNLPGAVLFPKTAAHIVAAINFAKEHKLEVSVKNSGHSYVGASTKKDTLHLNMNQYTAYAPTGVMECSSDDVETAAMSIDLSDQPCRLAKARGKQAVFRVGGGENFSDSYLGLKAFNEASKASGGSYKYHLVGGGAGSVSPMGWTFQGGLGSTTAGRLYGFGVDQVIRVDMVLPNGKHARFGPTEWEDAEGYLFPKTTKVTGVCQTNPDEEDESKWVWADCDDDTNFDDLWLAVRGGGGGTWGVVTSMILQLHDYTIIESFQIIPMFDCVPFEVLIGVKPFFDQFLHAFLLNPSTLVNVTEEDSKKCSRLAGLVLCYGEDSLKPFISAWGPFISEKNQTLVESGLPVSTVNDLASVCSNNGSLHNDYAEFAMNLQNSPDVVPDSPNPAYVSTFEDGINIIIPAKFYQENDPSATELFGPFYNAFGGNSVYTTDQADSLSAAHRTGGNMVGISLPFFDDDFYTNVFPKMFDTSDPENFPGFVGSNHVGPNTRGPLKSDWTKACPLDWTTEERNEKCISLQESIYGTKLLKKLEQIKDDIDPEYMFDCYGCIGNNRVKPVPAVIVEEEEEISDEEDKEVVVDVDEESTSGDEAVVEDGEGEENSSAFSNVSTVTTFVLSVFTLYFFVGL